MLKGVYREDRSGRSSGGVPLLISAGETVRAQRGRSRVDVSAQNDETRAHGACSRWYPEIRRNGGAPLPSKGLDRDASLWVWMEIRRDFAGEPEQGNGARRLWAGALAVQPHVAMRQREERSCNGCNG